ncbi:porin [Paraburkholderia rhizosphaerae]|uniref:Putative porin n=1 Tax=Paraburkholderia rhizosphaerae TaxID=480658 RepID=A0A4R8L5Y9_9BURK|nr:porin [Paraburkholderia rhizosphaerae]TDY37458.1 putative porin [Paraburkholderia rhizosphaerae]
MRRRHWVAALVLGSLFDIAHADDGNSVTLYGVLDVAVGVVEHNPNASAAFPTTVNPVSKVSTQFQKPVFGLFNGGISDPRWGIRGNENLGGGLHAFFDLESGFNLPSGQLNNAAASLAGPKNTVGAASALNGQFFNRAAYVGLRDDKFGSIAFGRSTTFGYDVITSYDPLFQSQLFSPLGFSGSYSAGGITEGSRTDNNIKYTNQIGDFNFGVSYSLGGVAGHFGDGSTFGAVAGYQNNSFGIQATYYQARDIVHSGLLVGANAIDSPLIGQNVGTLSLDNDYDYMIAAKYKFANATIKGGYERFVIKPPSDPAPAGTIADYFGFSGTLVNTTTTTSTNVYFFGGDYQFTPSFDVAAGIYDTQTEQSQGVAGGNQWQYSVLADYHFTRRTDVYAGYMFSKFNGAAFNGFQSTNYILATGLRTIF